METNKQVERKQKQGTKVAEDSDTQRKHIKLQEAMFLLSKIISQSKSIKIGTLNK